MSKYIENLTFKVPLIALLLLLLILYKLVMLLSLIIHFSLQN